MRTTINVPDKVMKNLMEVTGAKTKTEAVNEALEEFIRIRKREELIALAGKIHIEENWRELRDLELKKS